MHMHTHTHARTQAQRAHAPTYMNTHTHTHTHTHTLLETNCDPSSWQDTWHLTLEFARTVHPDLSNFDPDGALTAMSSV
jgi:hypothetical protein